MRALVHEMRNHLAVAVASIEAFRDGVLEPTPARMGAVLQALGEIDVLLRELPRVNGSPVVTPAPALDARGVDLGEIVVNEVLAFEPLAREKGAHFHLRERAGVAPAGPAPDADPVRAAEMIDAVLTNAIRRVPSGGRVEVDCVRAEAILRVTVDGGRDARAPEGFDLAHLRAAIERWGGSLEVQDVDRAGVRFTLRIA